MTLLPDWKNVLTRAWSVKCMAFAAMVSGCETLLQLGGASILPGWAVPAVTGVVTAVGILARVLAQKEAEHVAE